MLTTIEKVILLQAVDVFADVPTANLAYIAAIAEEVSFAAGTTIFSEGDPATAMFFVLDGRVSLQRDGNEIAVAEANQGFGVWALFDEERRVVTATTVTAVRLLRIESESFAEILADHAEIAQFLLKTLTRRLRSIMERLQLEHGRRPA